MGTSTNNLISRLDKVRRTGDSQWIALCPAHADKSPSLSICDTGNKVLIHCFAGCPAEDVLDAVGMRWGDLYSDENQAVFAAATSYKGRKFRPLKPLGPLEHERLIIEIGTADIRAGKTLSLEDRARLQTAVERVAASKEAVA